MAKPLISQADKRRRNGLLVDSPRTAAIALVHDKKAVVEAVSRGRGSGTRHNIARMKGPPKMTAIQLMMANASRSDIPALAAHTGTVPAANMPSSMTPSREEVIFTRSL
jgi:hypothetical protein